MATEREAGHVAGLIFDFLGTTDFLKGSHDALIAFEVCSLEHLRTLGIKTVEFALIPQQVSQRRRVVQSRLWSQNIWLCLHGLLVCRNRL